MRLITELEHMLIILILGRSELYLTFTTMPARHFMTMPARHFTTMPARHFIYLITFTTMPARHFIYLITFTTMPARHLIYLITILINIIKKNVYQKILYWSEFYLFCHDYNNYNIANRGLLPMAMCCIN